MIAPIYEPSFKVPEGALRIYFIGGKSVVLTGITREEILYCKRNGIEAFKGKDFAGTVVDVMTSAVTHLKSYPGKSLPHGEL